MKRFLKLPPWLPRLTRRQRVLRNLTAAVCALFLVWAVLDFPAPTASLAARWQAERYGLPAPEVLYCAKGIGKDAILRWEDGPLAIAKSYSDMWSWSLGDFWFTEPEDGGALLVPFLTDIDFDHTLYFWTERTDAARAEASLRIQTEVHVSVTESDGSGEEAHYHWDETYEMAAVPDQNGICRLEITPKYDKADFRLEASAERAAFSEFSGAYRDGSGVNHAAELRVSFYDEAGTLLDTWEKELYNHHWEEEAP